MENNILKKLNKNQKEAVLYNEGPLFVVAGAGTGKTRTLTHRVAYLYEQGIDPASILVLTFTNKAANEMKRRIIELVNQDFKIYNISTFHSFSFSFLKENVGYLKNNLNKDFSVADEQDSKKITKQVLEKLKPLDAKEADATYKDISKFRTENIKPKYKSFLDIYNSYEEELIKNNLIDFDNLLIFTKKILSENQEVKEKYSKLYKHILVDEFQDTDKVQYEILELLVNGNEEKDIFVVGDPDQSIYAFRGACYENNEKFLNNLKAKTITLNQNYRSVNNILKSANKIISFNQLRNKLCAEKKLESDLGEGHVPIYRVYNNYKDEADEIANSIKHIIEKENTVPSDIAILIRSNYLSRVFEEALIKNKISYAIYGGIAFFQRKEIKDLIAYLKVIINPNQDYYLKRVINTPKRQIGHKMVNELEKIAIENKISIFEAINYYSSGKYKDRLLKFKNMIKELKKAVAEEKDINNVIPLLVEKAEYLKSLEKLEEEKKQDKKYNIDQLSAKLVEFAKDKKETNLDLISKLLEEIELLTDNDLSKDLKNKVVLATYHKVKGLEFDSVFMPAMEEQILPNSIILKGNEKEVEEERRICYVGITRAKRRVIMSYSRSRYRFGRWHQAEPSRFLEESSIKSCQTQNKQKNLVGCKVWHPHFKEGIVLEDLPGGTLKILFEKDGIKQIVKTFPGLEFFNN